MRGTVYSRVVVVVVFFVLLAIFSLPKKNYFNPLLPGFTADTQVSNAVTVAETIIVGSVPDTYTYFATVPSNYDEYILSTN